APRRVRADHRRRALLVPGARRAGPRAPGGATALPRRSARTCRRALPRGRARATAAVGRTGAAMSATEPERPGVAPADGAPSGAPEEGIVEWRAVLSGALVGLAVLVVASIVGALLDRNPANYDDSAWRPLLFVVILIGYLSAGFMAGRRAP